MNDKTQELGYSLFSHWDQTGPDDFEIEEIGILNEHDGRVQVSYRVKVWESFVLVTPDSYPDDGMTKEEKLTYNVIYTLPDDAGIVAQTMAVATFLKVEPGTAASVIWKMENKGFLHYDVEIAKLTVTE